MWFTSWLLSPEENYNDSIFERLNRKDLMCIKMTDGGG